MNGPPRVLSLTTETPTGMIPILLGGGVDIGGRRSTR
jgi:hypothetical protein